MSGLVAVRSWSAINGGLRRRSGAETPPSTPYVVSPGGSIQSALTAAGTNGTVVVNTGTYIITTTLTILAGQTLWLSDGAVLDGSTALTSWTVEGSLWYCSGPLPGAYSDVGTCEVISGTESNQCQVLEDCFRDGTIMKRYMAKADLLPASANGGVYSCYADFTNNRVYVADNPNGHSMRMAKVRYLVNTTVSNWTLRGGTIQRFAPLSQTGAVSTAGANVTVRNAVFQWNHAAGLYTTDTTGLSVHDNQFVYNGQAGLCHHNCTGSTIQDNVASHNNPQRTYYLSDWESAGIKSTFSKDGVIRRNTCEYNNGKGIWLDVDNVGMTVGGAPGNGNTCRNNHGDGILSEIGWGGTDISYNTCEGDGHGQAYDGTRNADFSMLAGTAGININSCNGDDPTSGGTRSGFNVHDNTITNCENGISAQAANRGPSKTYPAVNWDLHGVQVYNNTVTQQVHTYVDINGVAHKAGTDKGLGEGVSGIRSRSPLDPYAYGTAAGNVFHDNVYILGDLVSGTAQSTKQRWSGATAPGVQSYLTFANIKSQAGQESGSTMTSTTG